MKLIEQLAREACGQHVCANPHTSFEEGFKHGFRAAKEMCASYRDSHGWGGFMDKMNADRMRLIGEEEVTCVSDGTD